eukprot:scaffold614626_cov37-Prasinocladus_malaysianus.AAC.1
MYARSQVALRRLVPYPATKRYTAITMQPQRPMISRILDPMVGAASAAKDSFGYSGLVVGAAVVGLGLLMLSRAF